MWRTVVSVLEGTKDRKKDEGIMLDEELDMYERNFCSGECMQGYLRRVVNLLGHLHFFTDGMIVRNKNLFRGQKTQYGSV